MTKNEIKWGCIQPLTGGMYLGTENAIGHKAEWIISYPGLTDIVTDKNGEVTDAANERNIYDYLKKHNRLPDWYFMNRTMMQNDNDLTPVYTAEDGSDSQPNLEVDLVVGVPVCAGLSMASTASQARKDECNCQMEWMAKYALNTIKPKVYIFENAPTLMSTRGDEVRNELETIAHAAGYSTVYLKTDTKYHHNCQKRPRTFIMFIKKVDGEVFIPEIQYERDNMSVVDFFSELTVLENDPMDTVIGPTVCTVDVPLAYVQHLYGEDWRSNVKGDIFDIIARDFSKHDDFMQWVSDNYDEKIYKWFRKYLDHIIAKVTSGYGYWSVTAKVFQDCLPACMYKNVPITIHHSENRLYTMREWMWSMGHPNDFNMVGKPSGYFRKMGQNVPVNTAKWVVENAARIICNWGNEPNKAHMVDNDMFNGATMLDIAYFDNTKQKRIY